MHIGMITSASLPVENSIGSYVWNLSYHLVKMGHRVDIIARGNSSKPKQEIIDGITIWRPRSFPNTPFQLDWHSCFVEERLATLPVDVLHLHSPLVRLPDSSLPKLVTVHGSTQALADKFGALGRVFAPLYQRTETALLANATKLVAVDAATRLDLGSYKLTPQQLPVIPHGIDTDLFQPGAADADRPQPYFFTSTPLERNHGIEDLLQSAAQLLRFFPNYKFYIAGEGSLKATIQKRLFEMDLTTNVFLINPITDAKQRRGFYRGATAYIHPAHYQTTLEPMLEAMACGRPVVATAVSDVPTLIQHKKNGLLVAPKQPRQLSNALATLIHKPELAPLLGRAARQTVLSSHSWEGLAAQYAAQYEQLLHKQPMSYIVPTTAPDFARLLYQ